jgi:hypothetical protein
MIFQRKFVCVSLLLFGLQGCCSDAPAPETKAHSQPSANPQAATTRQSVDHAEQIRDLIEQLAISPDDASQGPIYTPSRDAPKTDKRVIAYAAGDKLQKFGVEAFPLLLASMNDRRQSVAFRRALPSTVGDACYCIVMWQIVDLPENYRGSFVRKGADRQSYGRPVFSEHLFDPDTIKPWLAARSGRSLPELQLEAVSWTLERELNIGVQNEADEKTYIAPLRSQCEKLRLQIAEDKKLAGEATF